MRESSTAPALVRKDTRQMFQWRIRNLPYPKEVYSVTAEDGHLVIRTTVKKYFKKLTIPELDLLKLPLEQSR